MKNRELASDYVWRAEVRLGALEVLYRAGSWADVVRESQEVVELALKGLLRSCGIETTRIHDVSDILLAERERLPTAILPQLDFLCRTSRELRRDCELAFCGAEDLTPSGFYSEEDAQEAFQGARQTVHWVKPHVGI
jgi:HEPN domain-containing protein